MNEKKTIKIELSKSGIPCVWEEGGGMTNTGGCIIIANNDGTPPQAIYIKHKGHLACGKHALIPIKESMYIIDTWHHNQDFTIKISEISSINKDNKTAEIEEIYVFSENEWNIDVPEFLHDAIKAGMKKATCYHCRSPYFCKEPTRKTPIPE